MSATAVRNRGPVVAQAARLLAGWWSRPTEEETAGWTTAFEAALEVAELLGEPSARVGELEAALAAAVPAGLLEEHERLLVGPGRVPCAPYESLWRSDSPRRERGVLMGTPAADVARLYAELGLRVRSDARELPDHLVVEWEAVAYAYEHERADLAAILLGDHLAHWVPHFGVAVLTETGEEYYAVLARLTTEWTAAAAS